MKKTVLLAALFLSLQSFAQSIIGGYFASSYLYAHGNSEPQKVIKPLHIVYDRNYCQLFLDNVTYSFKVFAYETHIEKGNMVETFWNDETESTAKGWFSIMVVHNKPGTCEVTVNLPMIKGGAAYIAENAQAYSENGKVTGSMHIDNWKELAQQAHVDDSLAALRKARASDPALKRIDDSVAKERAFEKSLLKSDPSYQLAKTDPAEFEKLKQTVSAVISNDPHGMYIIKIDKDGYVKECIVSYAILKSGDELKGPKVVDKYNALETQYFKAHKYKVPPYVYTNPSRPAQNGMTIPASIYIQ